MWRYTSKGLMSNAGLMKLVMLHRQEPSFTQQNELVNNLKLDLITLQINKI